MDSKRCLPPAEAEAEVEEDGNTSQIAKRSRGLLVQEVVAELRPLLLEDIKRVIRRVVQEEVLKLLASPVQPASRLLINQDKEIKYRLHFQNKLPQDIFTFSRIVAAEGMEIQIAIMDSNLKEVITSNPLASVKVQIVVVYGDFGGDGQKNWTEEEFKDNVVSQRDNRGPLLLGELVIKLNNGIGYLSCAKFTDNSSWTRSQKFRLAVRIFQNENIEEKVQEGISEPFRVKDRRVELNQKHHPPLLTDEVWRLENIMRDGVLHKRLEKGGIHTVHQFLEAFTMHPEGLRTLLCDEVSKKRISSRRWDAIIAHAKECLLGADLCTYNVAAPQISMDNRKRIASETPNDIYTMVDNHLNTLAPANVTSVPGPSSLDPEIPYLHSRHQDEVAIQVGLLYQPNARCDKHLNGLSNAVHQQEGIHSVQEPSSLQETNISSDLLMHTGDLPVGSILTPTMTAIATPIPELSSPVPLNPDYPATHYDEPAAHWDFQHLNQDLSNEQGFYQVQQPAFFQANISNTADIFYENGFRSRLQTSEMDRNMPEVISLESWQPKAQGAVVPTSPRKWAKLVYGLKFWISMSKHIGARRTGYVHLKCPNMVPSSCLNALGAG